MQFKCPSCSIILEVKNSRNEAVKKIVCPNCGKTLSVTFRDEPKPQATPQPIAALYCGKDRYPLVAGINHVPLLPANDIEVKLVQIAEGNSKCIVRMLREGLHVAVNGQPLLAGDEVVLLRGDELQVNQTLLTFDKEERQLVSPNAEPQSPAPAQEPAHTPTTPVQPPRKSPVWLFLPLLLGIGLAAWLLWPSKTDKPQAELTEDTIGIKETPVVTEKSVVPSVSSEKKVKEEERVTPKQEPARQDNRRLTDYELEQLALKGDVSAQFEIGKRFVSKRDSVNVLKGMKYLHLAASNGSSEARRSLTSVLQSLQKAAQAGNPHAQNLLESIETNN